MANARRVSSKRKKGTAEQLVRWHLGIHVEAVGKMIADALHRIAAQMERDHALKSTEIDLRREHLLNVLGLIPDMGTMRVHDLRGGFKMKDCRCAETDGKDCPIPFHQEVRGLD